MKRSSRRLAAGLLLGVLAAGAEAGYDAGIEAFKGKQWPLAFQELRQAFDGGDLRAAPPLAQLYLNGAGTAKNTETAIAVLRQAAGGKQTASMRLLANLHSKGIGTAQNSVEARRWAEQAIAAGDRDAYFDYYAIHLDDPRYRYLGGDGKADAGKYSALAARPAAARADDVRAFEHLAAGARMGDNRARMMLGVFHFEHVGRDAIGRARGAFAANTETMPQGMAKFPTMLADIAARGPTQASAKVFLDALQTGIAKVGLTMRQKDKNARIEACTDLALPRIKASTPVRNAIYLPLAGDLAEAYLLQGEWSEKWVFTACGKDYPVDVDFAADGYGGARFSFKDPA